MGWKDLITSSERAVLPWTGGPLRVKSRSWQLDKRPPGHGWHEFELGARRATWLRTADPAPEALGWTATGFLVGDRLVRDDSNADPDPAKIVKFSEPVLLIEDGLDRFARISVGRTCEDGPLFYAGPAMPLGPEQDVTAAYEDKLTTVSGIKDVTPALDAAFRMECWQRSEAERRRAELERARIERERIAALEARRKEIVETLGDAAGRRHVAAYDFAEAARAALAMGGATYLDHKAAVGRNEMTVRFRLDNRRFECTCDRNTLSIIDAGICLTAHYDDPDFEGGTKGDTFFTLESLPGVILEAIRNGVLVVFRHAR